jgi:uncharacterized protein (DUF433 family)
LFEEEIEESLMPDSDTYVRTDEHGVMRVGNTRVSLDSVVIPFQNGDAPESIRSQYPSLTLEQVYGAITYYLAHKPQVDEYLERQQAQFEELKAQIDRLPTPPVVQRLRALKSA